MRCDGDQSVFDVNNEQYEREQVMMREKLRHGQEFEEEIPRLRDEDE